MVSLRTYWSSPLVVQTQILKDFGKTPGYITRYKAEKEAEERRWQEENLAQHRRKEAAKLSEEEKLQILQVKKENIKTLEEPNWDVILQVQLGSLKSFS